MKALADSADVFRKSIGLFSSFFSTVVVQWKWWRWFRACPASSTANIVNTASADPQRDWLSFEGKQGREETDSLTDLFYPNMNSTHEPVKPFSRSVAKRQRHDAGEH